MGRIMTCITPETLSTLLHSPAVDELKEFINCDTPEALSDRLWDEQDEPDLVIVDRGIVDSDDILASGRNNPSTLFLVKEDLIAEKPALKNVVVFADQAELAQTLRAPKPAK